MSETRFTPGEWKAVAAAWGDTGAWVVISHDGATLRKIATFEPSHYVSAAECEANAKALVASKELYAALQSAHGMLLLLGVALDDHAEGRRIVAALAKANPQPKEGSHAELRPTTR